MRLIKYFAASSLDNFISRKDGSVDWLFMDQDYGMTEFFASVDVAVLGRKTYEKMLELSPKAPFFGAMKYCVFSRSLRSTPYEQVELVPGDVTAWANLVRSQPGKDIWLVGGSELAREFLQHRLVNEIGISILPRLLGEGVPLFAAPYPETELELVRSKQYSSGLLQAFYRIK